MARQRRRGTVVPLDKGPKCTRWLVRIATGKDPVTGKYTRLNKVVHGPKRDAESVLTSLLGQQDQGVPLATGKDTLGAWLEQSLATASDLAPQTIHRARSAFKQLPPVLVSRRLRDLTAEMFTALYAELSTQGKAPGTVRYLHRCLKVHLNRAVAAGKLGLTPFRKPVILPRQEQVERTTLTGEQVARLIEATAEHRLGALWALLAVAGLRPEEALALRWSDYEDGTLQVRRALVHLPKIGFRFEPTKTKQGRSVPLPPSGIRALQRHRALQNQERLLVGSAYATEGLIFATELGRPLQWTNVSRVFRAEIKRLGLPTLRPYDLRHSHATLLLEAGVSAKVVQERLGHSSIKVTLDVYAHVTETMQADANARLEAALAGGVRQSVGNSGGA